ncbi:uncharacterized protein [Lolium perenne]|uniref:uncharacterized protein n=1 Tax=Lolium perenne TaxID=4522 RepID=UPI003A99DD75
MEDREAARAERQANLATLQHLAQLATGNANHNNGGNENGDPCSKLKDFQSTNPPDFAKCTEPLDADDWLRTIENNLEVAGVGNDEKVLFATHFLSGPARAWWESVKAMQVEGHVINWEEFKAKFRKTHIPSGMIKIMKDKFMNLRQGSMSMVDYLDKFTTLSRYAPEDTNTKEKKKDRFLNGLDDKLQSILVAVPYPDLESLVDASIMVESKRKNAFENRKRKAIMLQGNSSTQQPCSLPPPRPAPQQQWNPPPAPCPNSLNKNPNYNRQNNTVRKPPNGCYACGHPDHYSNECPKKVTSGQRPNAPKPNQGKSRTASGRNQNHMKPAGPPRRHLNHVTAEEAREAPDIILGTFLVNSVPSTVLFDSGASHSFVTKPFVRKGGLTPTPMKRPMLVQIPGSTRKTQSSCKEVPIEIQGKRFHADLIVLGEQGLEVILGMNWMVKYKGHIDCVRRAITLTAEDGEIVEHLLKKDKKFEWTDKCEASFQELKKRLVTAPVLTIPDITKDFDVYCDASKLGLGSVLMQEGKRELNMRQSRWMELIKDYDLGIHYHPGKANVVADALSREPCSLNALIKLAQPKLYEELEEFGLELVSQGFLANLELKPTLFDQIKEAQVGHESIEGIKRRMDREEVPGFAIDAKGVLWYNERLCKVKAEHQRPAGLLQPLKVPEWKWEEVGMDFITGLPKSQRGHDSIWVIVDRLTKVAHFIPVKTTYCGFAVGVAWAPSPPRVTSTKPARKAVHAGSEVPGALPRLAAPSSTPKNIPDPFLRHRQATVSRQSPSTLAPACGRVDAGVPSSVRDPSPSTVAGPPLFPSPRPPPESPSSAEFNAHGLAENCVPR